MDFCNVTVTTSPIAIPTLETSAGAGAVVDFLGVVRPTENERPILAIEYEHHPVLAEKELLRIANESADQFALLTCTLIHRVGWVGAGEVSLFLRVASAHRAEAFDASRWIVEQLKIRVPIWKHVVAAPTST